MDSAVRAAVRSLFSRVISDRQAAKPSSELIAADIEQHLHDSKCTEDSYRVFSRNIASCIVRNAVVANRLRTGRLTAARLTNSAVTDKLGDLVEQLDDEEALSSGLTLGCLALNYTATSITASYFDAADLVSVSRVSKACRRVASCQALWHELVQQDFRLGPKVKDTVHDSTDEKEALAAGSGASANKPEPCSGPAPAAAVPQPASVPALPTAPWPGSSSPPWPASGGASPPWLSSSTSASGGISPSGSSLGHGGWSPSTVGEGGAAAGPWWELAGGVTASGAPASSPTQGSTWPSTWSVDNMHSGPGPKKARTDSYGHAWPASTAGAACGSNTWASTATYRPSPANDDTAHRPPRAESAAAPTDRPSAPGTRTKPASDPYAIVRRPGESWKATYMRLHHERVVRLRAEKCQIRVDCRTCNGKSCAVVRYHSRAMRTVKYSDCQDCGRRNVLEDNDGDLPKMGMPGAS